MYKNEVRVTVELIRVGTESSWNRVKLKRVEPNWVETESSWTELNRVKFEPKPSRVKFEPLVELSWIENEYLSYT